MNIPLVAIGLVSVSIVPGVAYGAIHLSSSESAVVETPKETKVEQTAVEQTAVEQTAVEQTAVEQTAVEQKNKPKQPEIPAKPIVQTPSKPSVPRPAPRPVNKPSVLSRPYPGMITSRSVLPEKSILDGLQEIHVGHKYKEYLLGDRTDPVWESRLNTWTKTVQDAEYSHRLTSKFLTRGKQPLNLETLQKKCRQAYTKKNWNDNVDRREKDFYWSTVKAMCGRNIEFPSEWGSW